MIITAGTVVAIRARLVKGLIVWSAATPGNIQDEAVARAVNAHDALLAACRFSASVHRDQGLYDLSERMAVERLEAAIAKAEAS